ncbi:TetR/AcrR family transcriptional regulator (plasmid) [Rhizobium sp. CB3171]|uniref:TetR/AcrR family transcriptional regulator n=1 Tax=Rhizobium sp. CB3171 TaxID=3039157 RepID=UPI0024B07F34|nr:TetR/AcrR family transcriptional regulator [Rhizobium sp. CB3171]WFU04622.1 TetR/AcrR family transcriptional regulator [Rhizobium sp. CB3171]
MSEDTKSSNDAGEQVAGRRRRADARRNIGSLIQTASEVFAEAGLDVPIREIADRAGVGVGTLYRHFPTRSDLVVSVFRKEVDESVEAAKTLVAENPPGEALELWVKRYVDFITAHRGLASAFNSGDPAMEGLPAYFLERLGPLVQKLLDAAATNGQIRAGVKASELLHGAGMLCVPPSCGGQIDPQRMVGLFMDGLRYGATTVGDKLDRNSARK